MKNLLSIFFLVLLSQVACGQMQGGHLTGIGAEIEYLGTNSHLERGIWKGQLNAKAVSVVYIPLSNMDSLISLEVFVDGEERPDLLEQGGIFPKYDGFVSPVSYRNVPFDRSKDPRSFEIHFEILRRNPVCSFVADLGQLYQSETYSYTFLVPDSLKFRFQMQGDTTWLQTLSIDSLIKDGNRMYQFAAVYESDFMKGRPCYPRFLPTIRLWAGEENEDLNYQELADKLRSFFSLPTSPEDSLVQRIVRLFQNSGTERDKALAVFRYLQKTYRNFEPGLDWPHFQPGVLADLENRELLFSPELNQLYYTIMRELGVYTMLVASNPLASSFDLNTPMEAAISYFGCALNFDNAWHFADFQSGTFIPFHPNVNLQGKHYLLFDDVSFEYSMMKTNEPEENMVLGEATIRQTQEGFEGTCIIKFTGLSQAELSEVLFGSNETMKEMVLENYFSGGTDKVKYREFSNFFIEDTLAIQARLKAGKDLLKKHKGKHYLEPAFNIYPHNLSEKADYCTPESVHSSYKPLSVFRTTIQFLDEHELNQSYSLSLDEKGLKHAYEVKQKVPNQLEFRYLFSSQYIYMPRSVVPFYKSGTKELSGIMYRPMVLQ